MSKKLMIGDEVLVFADNEGFYSLERSKEPALNRARIASGYNATDKDYMIEPLDEGFGMTHYAMADRLYPLGTILINGKPVRPEDQVPSQVDKPELAIGDRVKVKENPFCRIDGTESRWSVDATGATGEVVTGPDKDGDYGIYLDHPFDYHMDLSPECLKKLKPEPKEGPEPAPEVDHEAAEEFFEAVEHSDGGVDLSRTFYFKGHPLGYTTADGVFAPLDSANPLPDRNYAWRDSESTPKEDADMGPNEDSFYEQGMVPRVERPESEITFTVEQVTALLKAFSQEV